MARTRGKQLRCDRLLALLEARAAAGEPFPNNDEICDVAGIAQEQNVAAYIDALQADGLIGVERDAYLRRATICATGQMTAWSISKRGRPVGRVSDLRRGNAEPDVFRGAVPEHQRVDREPCAYCGVRADVGCRHVRRMAA